MDRDQLRAEDSRESESSTTLDQDPLYDAAYLVFVYAGWVTAAWLVGPMGGLAVLVAGTALLTLTGLGSGDPDGARSFATDLAVVLLFCSAAIAVAVFYLGALEQAALLTLWVTATAITIVAFAASSGSEAN
ncbi:MAG: hypothetical protein ACR2PK_03005 [Acidimicrobiales bacterium]